MKTCQTRAPSFHHFPTLGLTLFTDPASLVVGSLDQNVLCMSQSLVLVMPVVILVLHWLVVVSHLVGWGFVLGQFLVVVVGSLAGVLTQLVEMDEDGSGFSSVFAHLVLPRCMTWAHSISQLLPLLATCQMSFERGLVGQVAEVVSLWRVDHGTPSGKSGDAVALPLLCLVWEPVW